MAETLWYNEEYHQVIPRIADAASELNRRKATGEKGIAILDISFHSNKVGYIIYKTDRRGDL